MGNQETLYDFLVAILERAIAIPALILLSGCVGSNRPDLTQKCLISGTWLCLHGGIVDLRSWWQTFNDPVLDELVENALANNLNIAQAEQWLKTAQALNGATASSYLPHLRAGSACARCRCGIITSTAVLIWYGSSASMASQPTGNRLGKPLFYRLKPGSKGCVFLSLQT